MKTRRQVRDKNLDLDDKEVIAKGHFVPAVSLLEHQLG